MNSIISLSWQLEIKNCPITITILKNSGQTPHHYFYSSNQNRVLRKKTPNIPSLIYQSQQPTQNKNPSKLLKITRNKNNQTISFQFCEGCTAIEHLETQEFQGQFSVIENDCQLCRVIMKGMENNDEIQVQYLTSSKPILNPHKSLLTFTQNLKKTLVSSLNKKSSQLYFSNHQQPPTKIIFIQLLLAINFITINHQSNAILLVETTHLHFINQWQQSMFSISCRMKNREESRQERKINKQIKNQVNSQQQYVNQNPQKNNINQQAYLQIKKQQNVNILKIEKQSIKQQEIVSCGCCSLSVPSTNCKQITNEDLVALRKLCKLTLRGFTEQYYSVCYDCYLKL